MKDGTQSKRKHGMHFARVRIYVCMCVCVCVWMYIDLYVCGIQCKRKDEEYDEDDG